MGIRGFVRAIYIDDDGNEWQLLVDADSAEDAARGWVTLGSESRAYLPRAFLPRRVVGIDESGRQQDTRVGTTSCALWTGTVSSFTVEATDGTLATAEVTSRQQERQVGPAAHLD